METQNCMHCGNKIDDRGMNGYCSPCLSWCADSFLPGQIEKRTLQGSKRCLVKDCENTSDLGRFVGDLCSPCHATMIGCGGEFSQLYRNMKEGTKVNVKMVLVGSFQPDDRRLLEKIIEVASVPRKGDRFSVINQFGKAVFEIAEVELVLNDNPVCYLTGLGVASTSFGASVLIESGWQSIAFSVLSSRSKEDSNQESEVINSPKIRDDIAIFTLMLKNRGLSPTKQNHFSFGRYTAVWHTDNDSDRWVRVETLMKTPGFLLSYVDSLSGVKTEMLFESSISCAFKWVSNKLQELGKRRSPWSD